MTNSRIELTDEQEKLLLKNKWFINVVLDNIPKDYFDIDLLECTKHFLILRAIDNVSKRMCYLLVTGSDIFTTKCITNTFSINNDFKIY